MIVTKFLKLLVWLSDEPSDLEDDLSSSIHSTCLNSTSKVSKGPSENCIMRNGTSEIPQSQVNLVPSIKDSTENSKITNVPAKVSQSQVNSVVSRSFADSSPKQNTNPLCFCGIRTLR